MEHRPVFVLLVLGILYVESEGRRICSPAKLGQCQNRLERFNQSAPSLHMHHGTYPCGESINIRQCFSDYADNCFTSTQKANEFLFDNLKEHLESFRSHCRGADCVESGNSEDAVECQRAAKSAGMSTSRGGDALSENNRKCMAFGVMMDCIVEKMSYRCGEEAARELSDQIVQQSKRIIDACNNGEYVDFELVKKK